MPITYSRRRISSGRKSRVPPGGFVDPNSPSTPPALPALPARPAHVIQPVADVSIGVPLDAPDLGVGERPLHLPGTAHHERPRRHLHLLDHERSGGHNRSGADVS